MSNALPAVIVVGGVAYYLSDHGAPVTAPQPAPPGTTLTNATPGSTIGQKVKGLGARANPSFVAIMTSPSNGQINPAAGPGGGNWSQYSPAEQALQAKLHELDTLLRTAYSGMSSDARKAGAKALNEEYNIDPPLKGTESFDELASVAGAAIGSAALGAIGGPLGAKLGAILGAYLGGEIADWLANRWEDVKEWAEGELEKVKDAFVNWDGRGAPWYRAMPAAKRNELLMAIMRHRYDEAKRISDFWKAQYALTHPGT